MRILYDSRSTDFKVPFGPVKESEDCRLWVHIPAECNTRQVFIRLCGQDGSPASDYPMSRESAYGGYEIYTCSFSVAAPGLYFYYFQIVTENESFRLFRIPGGMTNMEDGDMWQLSVLPADYTVPSFYAGRIMYQIFPDRFNKAGECCLEGKITPFTVHKAFDEAPVYNPDDPPADKNSDFFGGNLRGIEDKLGYLSELGVSVIYLNPIFKAHSNHRYDTADYLKTDEMLGTDADFESLCRAAHSKDIKIIIDGVFSHTGSESVYFDIDGRFGNGAYGNPASPYRSWYQFSDGEPGYNCWWGVPTLPCTDELDPGFQSFILDKVIPKWLGLGADGIRLDVADELPDAFIKKLRDRARQIKPDAFIIGEVWEDASNKISYSERRRYFTGAELDSVMNYPFRSAITDFVCGNTDAGGFAEAVMTIAENYPQDVLLSLMNMLSTHDTPRILTLLGADGTADGHAAALARLDEAVAMQFLLPGMPCIYYGDEIGMEGGKDPDNRRYFDWNKSPDCTPIYRIMCDIRKHSDILRLGSFTAYVQSPDLAVTVRSYKGRVLRGYFASASGLDYTPFGECIYSEGCTGSHIGPHGFAVCISDS